MAVGTPTNPVAVGASSTTTNSGAWTPSTNCVLIARVSARGASAVIPSISDTGATWDEISGTGIDNNSLTSKLWKLDVGASAPSLNTTGDSTGATQVALTITEYTGGEVQASNVQSGQSGSGDPTVTFNAFAANSAAYVSHATANGGATSPPTGYTELYDAAPATNLRVAVGYDLTSPDTAPAYSGAGTDSIMYGVEIKEKVAGATIVAAGGSYSLAGFDMTVLISKFMTASAGSYALSGSDANLALGRALVAETGSYAITGSAVNFFKGRTLEALEGSYNLTGTDVNFLHSLVMPAAAGSYSITGSTVNLNRGRSIVLDAGSYTISGSVANFLRSRLVVAESGAYTLSGSAADLEFGRKNIALAGAYVIAGFDVSLSISTEKKILAETGSYAITGGAVTLQYGQLGNAEAFRPALFHPLRTPMLPVFTHERYEDGTVG